MALDYQALKDELTAGHPDTGAYNADDALAADQLNALNRPVVAAAREIRDFLYFTLHNEGSGDDTNNANIWGRIQMVAEASVNDNVFGVSPADPVQLNQIAAAKTLLQLLAQDDFSTLLAEAGFDSILTKLQGAGALSPGDKNTLQGLADNKQSRATEINFGRNTVNATHVATARAL